MAMSSVSQSISARTFDILRELVYEKSGISLGPGKEALVSARVQKRMRALKINDHQSYLRYLEEDTAGEELVSLLDAISTNVTSFFREGDHFEILANAFSKWVAGGQRRFRFWSAACSTGEEPYTLAMTLEKVAPNADLNIRILATDISTQVLDHARHGVYAESKVAPIPVPLRHEFFSTYKENGERVFAVTDSLKRRVHFTRLNLSAPPFPMQGPLDAIFCRNVMIYFDNVTRQGLIDEAIRMLKPGGYLFVGHAESLSGVSNTLKTIRPSVYLKE